MSCRQRYKQDSTEAGHEFEIERLDRGEYRLRRRSVPPNDGLVDWLLSSPHKGFFVPIGSESRARPRSPRRRTQRVYEAFRPLFLNLRAGMKAIGSQLRIKLSALIPADGPTGLASIRWVVLCCRRGFARPERRRCGEVGLACDAGASVSHMAPHGDSKVKKEPRRKAVLRVCVEPGFWSMPLHRTTQRRKRGCHR